MQFGETEILYTAQSEPMITNFYVLCLECRSHVVLISKQYVPGVAVLGKKSRTTVTRHNFLADEEYSAAQNVEKVKA